MCLELDYPSQGAVVYELLEGEEVGIPAAVLVYGEELVAFFGNRDEFVCFLRGGGEWLLDDYCRASG